VLLQPRGHPRPHPPEADHPEVHATSSSLTRTIRLPRSSSAA
jgi:hypothetical protein